MRKCFRENESVEWVISTEMLAEEQIVRLDPMEYTGIIQMEKAVFETEDGDIELYVLEQTTLFGVNYILVTDDEESEDGSFFVLKEEPDSEGDVVSYAEVEDENELKAVIKIFDELLEDIDLEV